MRVFLTGARGMLGSSLALAFERHRPDVELIGVGRDDLDLRDRDAVAARLAAERPDAIVHAAARVGGIAAKLARPTGFLLDNLRIDSAVIDAALAAEVPELLYIGSAAVYPAEVAQPIVESAVLGGDEAIGAFAKSRLSGLEQRILQLKESLPATEAVAQALREEGFAASLHDGPVGQQLCQQHCPVAHVAHEFPQLCEAETEAISLVLGSHVQRLATIAHGDGVCTTCIPSTQLQSTPNKTKETVS